MEKYDKAPTTPSVGDGIWMNRFFGLVDFVKTYSWFDERSDFYKSLAANLGKITGADIVNIRLLTPSQDSFVLYAYHGDIGAEVNREYSVLSANIGRMPHLIETGEPIVFDFAHPASDDVEWDRGNDDGFSCSVTIALSGVQGIVGTADLLFRDAQDWNEPDIAWFRGLGEFVGATIGNALLSDNMFGLRIAEERRNLSSEIHDNVAQSVSVIALEADNAFDSLAHKDTVTLEHNLDLIKRAADELDTAIRGELANLKSGPNLDENPSMAQLEQIVATLCSQWGLECEIIADDASRETIIPKRIMVQLTRVVHEALINVIRHAQASKAVVSYNITDAGLSLSVEDNGCGFDVSAVSPTHLGLRIMRERLESVGASLDIDSSAQNGTCIGITVPYLV